MRRKKDNRLVGIPDIRASNIPRCSRCGQFTDGMWQKEIHPQDCTCAGGGNYP